METPPDALTENSTIEQIVLFIKKLTVKQIIVVFVTLSTIIGGIFAAGNKVGYEMGQYALIAKVNDIAEENMKLKSSAVNCDSKTGELNEKVKALEARIKFYDAFVNYILLKQSYTPASSPKELKNLEDAQSKVSLYFPQKKKSGDQKNPAIK